MQELRSHIFGLFIIVMCHTVLSAPLNIRVKRQSDSELDGTDDISPIVSEDAAVDFNDLDRNKRKIPETFAAKNAILGFVFGGSQKIGTASAPITKPPPIRTTTDDTPDFDRARVSLEIPDKLFGSSFTLVTNVSKVFGDLIMNSARRYSQFVQFFKPLLGKALTVKGYRIPVTTTTTTESNST